MKFPTQITKYFWLGLGGLSLVLGVVGVVLPILPTTPFILLATYSFAKSSPRLHTWLVTHKRFGSVISDWHNHGAISKKGKILALTTMLMVLALSLWMGFSPTIIGIQVLVMGGAATFILTRPLPPRILQKSIDAVEKEGT